MTREEAIKILSNRDSFGVPKGYTSGYAEAIDMAIHSLEAWDEVIKDLHKYAINQLSIGRHDFANIVFNSMDVIDKRMKEVEK